jgi:hypothetical protein
MSEHAVDLKVIIKAQKVLFCDSLRMCALSTLMLSEDFPSALLG